MRGAALLFALAMMLGQQALAFDPFAAAGIVQKPGAVIPMTLSFHDENAQPVTLGELAAGKPMLLVPVLHHCPNICGVTLAGLMQAIRAQRFKPGRDFTIIAFGIDPTEGPSDAAASLRKLKANFSWLDDRQIHGLTGSAEAIAAVTDKLGYRYAWDDAIGQYAHIAATAVLTPQGKLARWLYGLTPDPHDLGLALTEAGEGRIGTWTDQLLLLCYHYDPQTGRYGPIVWTALRIAGGFSVMLAALLVGRALLHEYRRRRGL